MTGFYSCHKTAERVCMDFEPYFKVYNLVSVHSKSIIVGQMTNLDMIFYMMVSVYRLKFETRPSSLLNFRMAYCNRFSTIHWLIHQTKKYFISLIEVSINKVEIITAGACAGYWSEKSMMGDIKELVPLRGEKYFKPHPWNGILVPIFKIWRAPLSFFPRGWGRVLLVKLGGVCGTLPKTLSLFMTKIWDIQNIPYLWPKWPKSAKIETLYMTKMGPHPWCRTYLYSPYKWIPPGPFCLPTEFSLGLHAEITSGLLLWEKASGVLIEQPWCPSNSCGVFECPFLLKDLPSLHPGFACFGTDIHILSADWTWDLGQLQGD